jgi:hypothetical protein
MRRLDRISRAVLRLLLLVAASAAAQQIKPSKTEDFKSFDGLAVEQDLPCATEQYQVREGDTLSSISGKILGSPNQWPQIFRLNPELKSPSLIQPRQSLRVPRCGAEELFDWQNHYLRADELDLAKLDNTLLQFSVPFAFDEYHASIHSRIAAAPTRRSSRSGGGTFSTDIAPSPQPPFTLMPMFQATTGLSVGCAVCATLPQPAPPADTPPSVTVPALQPQPVTSTPQSTLPADTPPPPSPPAPVPAPQTEQVPPAPASPPTNDATAPATAPPPAERRLHWNAWLEKHGTDTPAAYGKEMAVTVLEPGTTYTLNLDIAMVAYLHDVVSQEASARTAAVIRQVMAGKQVQLQAIVLTEDEYFEAPKITRRFTIDLTPEKLKKALAAPIDGDPFTLLGEDPNRDFVLAHQPIELTTKTGSAIGPTTIVIVILKDRVPIEELLVHECYNGTIPDDCSGSSLLATGVFDIPGGTSGTEAYASLYFIQTSPDGEIMAFLHRPATKPEDEYVEWSLRASSYGDLQNFLNNSLMNDLNAAITSKNLVQIGQAGQNLFRALFGPKKRTKRKTFPWLGSEEEEPEAGLAMRDLLRERKAAGGARVPLHVRVIPYRGDPVPLLPFSLLAMQDVEGPTAFTHIGKYFRVEAPAPKNRYETPQNCVQSWLVVMPEQVDKGDTELVEAKTKAKDAYAWTSKDLSYFCDIGWFIDWIDRVRPLPKAVCPPATPELATATIPPDGAANAFLILSHSGNDAFSFGGPRSLNAQTFANRTFVSPSVAILNGCGTAGPASTHLIPIMNGQGFAGFIATGAQVNGDVAGDFTSELTRQIPPGGITLRNALEATYSALQANNPNTHYPFDLVYTLVGNGDIKLCAPAERVAPPPPPPSPPAPSGGLQ